MNSQVTEKISYLKNAGFSKLARKEEALKIGTIRIPSDTVAQFSKSLRKQRKEYDFHELADYEPAGVEEIPVKELEKIAQVKKAGLFDKIMVVGTKKIKNKKREVDPIVIGLILSESELMDVNMDVSSVAEFDWYFIAGWK